MQTPEQKNVNPLIIRQIIWVGRYNIQGSRQVFTEHPEDGVAVVNRILNDGFLRKEKCLKTCLMKAKGSKNLK